MEHYDELLELATGDDDDASLVKSSIYFNINDVIPDGKGVLGLVDDLYALEQLNKVIIIGLFNLKWRFEMEFQIFNIQSLLINLAITCKWADDFIKAALFST